MNVVALILAGGNGTRLWPLSTAAKPKQFRRLLCDRTMLQLTSDRLVGMVPPERTFVSVRREHVPLVHHQLPQIPGENVLPEPEVRDTAGALGYAAFVMQEKFGNCIMLVVASDQLIEPISQFQEALQAAVQAAKSGKHLVSVGVPPSEPNVQYGYMECGAKLAGSPSGFQGVRYVEKPDLATARGFLEAGTYLWNTNIFVWQTDHLLSALEFYQPTIYRLLKTMHRIRMACRTYEPTSLYQRLPKISIDYGVMEQVKPGDDHQHVFVKGHFSWSDVGSYRTLEKTCDTDHYGNRRRGDVRVSGTENCLLFCEAPWSLEVNGLSGCNIVVGENGEVFLSPRHNDAADLRKLWQSGVSRSLSQLESFHADARLVRAENIAFRAERGMLCAIDMKGVEVQVHGQSVTVTSPATALGRDVMAANSASDDLGIGGNLTVAVGDSYGRMSELAAEVIVESISSTLAVKGHAQISASAGSTPEGLYWLLRTRYRGCVDWSRVTFFQMDEYLGLDPANGRSMAAFLLNRVIQPLGINNFVPLPKSPEDDAFLQHERRIEQGGGLDLVVHGIGRNGHLGFNEPGSAFDSRTRVVELSPSTRQANQRFFSENEPTPGFGVTLGLGTMFAAERVILLASGEAKRDAIQRCVWGPSTLQTPASMLQKHPNIDVIIDQDACGWLEAVEDKSMAAIAGPDRVLDNLSTGSGSEGGTQIPIIGDEPLRRAA